MLLVASKVSYLKLGMASEPEPEPDFRNVTNFGISDVPVEVPDEHCDIFC